MSRPRIEELLAAYASGATLTDEERSAVEALLDQSPAARAEVDDITGLLGALREAEPEPPAASEAVVRAVRIACAAEQPWTARAGSWLRRRWSIAVPATLAAGALAIVAAVHLGRPAEPDVRVDPSPIADPGPDPAPAPSAPPDVPVWLDGEATELAQLDDATAEELDRELGDELDALEGGSGGAIDDAGFDGILPDDDLDWVDQLDDATAEELDRWLAEHPS